MLAPPLCPYMERYLGGGEKGLHSTVGGGDVLTPPLCPYMEKKGGEEGLQHTMGGGMCWLRPFDHIWGDEGRRGFIALWVGGCADSTPLTIYGKIRGGWGGEKGLHSTMGGGMCWLRPFAHIWRDKGRRGIITVWVMC